MEEIQRYYGSLMGLAVGDALGMALEFCPPGSFTPVTEILGGGRLHLPPGYWTDDTSMALCLAESLVECQGFDPIDQLKRYLRWYREGYFSSTGKCFDIGSTVRTALTAFERSGQPYCGPTDPRTAGNGSLMRLAPVPLYYANQPSLAIEKAAASSRTTHGALEAIDACRYFAALLVGAVNSVAKKELLDKLYSPIPDIWQQAPLTPKIKEIAAGSFKQKNPPDIRGTGYVVDTLEAALWAFYHSSTFRQGALLAVNLGEDADTTGAVYGQLAGAYYGLTNIPDNWRNKIIQNNLMTSLAGKIYQLRN